MEQIIKIDNDLYKALYIKKDLNLYKEIWSKIKENQEILKQAIKVTRNKWDSGDTLIGATIADLMLINYYDMNNDIYYELINTIYSNQDIARMVLNGASNGGYSFLLMSLWNHKLKLTEEQKRFAVTEAMYKIGTTYWSQKRENFSKELDAMGVTDQKTVLIDYGQYKTPIGQKTKEEYMHYILYSLGNEQAHGVGSYDIRYCILRNPNWTIEEKERLIMEFWSDEEEYSDVLDEWEWGIINDLANYQGEYTVTLHKDYLYQYSYRDLLILYNKDEEAKKIWDEINFCRQMHQMREPYWKKDSRSKTLSK